MIDNLEFGVYPEWLALPLDQSAESLTADIVASFADDPKPDEAKRAVASGLATLRSQIVDVSSERMQVFMTWVLLPLGGKILSPQAAAYGALVPAPPGTSPSEFVEAIIDGAALHQPVDLQELSTPLGTAHVVRARTFERTDHGVKLSETVSVFWLPEDDDIAILLSSLPVDDLVQASDVASALIGLAETASATEVAR